MVRGESALELPAMLAFELVNTPNTLYSPTVNELELFQVAVATPHAFESHCCSQNARSVVDTGWVTLTEARLQSPLHGALFDRTRKVIEP